MKDSYLKCIKRLGIPKLWPNKAKQKSLVKIIKKNPALFTLIFHLSDFGTGSWPKPITLLVKKLIDPTQKFKLNHFNITRISQNQFFFDEPKLVAKLSWCIVKKFFIVTQYKIRKHFKTFIWKNLNNPSLL